MVDINILLNVVEEVLPSDGDMWGHITMLFNKWVKQVGWLARDCQLTKKAQG